MKLPLHLVLKNKLAYFPIGVFAALTIWWVVIQNQNVETTQTVRQIWAAIYQVIALYGAIIGLFISQNWGGYKSVFGKSILFFSLGLFLQSFGQSSYSYYIFFKRIDVPYPSIGDIGFFGSVLAYIYAVVLLSKTSGLKISSRSLKGKMIAILIPILMLLFSYRIFLQSYEFDFSDKLKIFLDFGYPLGQAIYVSIAFLTLLMCRNVLGGIMKRPILFLLFALIFQYFSDFMFLYQANKGLWIVGGMNDYLYSTAYLLMTLGLIYLGSAFHRIRES